MIPSQQHAPIINGFPPVLINFIMLVFSPIADIAVTIRNLLNVFNGIKKSPETPKDSATVVMIEAITK